MRTYRRQVSLGAIIGVLAGLFLGGTQAAQATHGLTISHQPLANGIVAGDNQDIYATVSTTCAPSSLCNNVRFYVHYVDRFGQEGTVEVIGSNTTLQNFVATVPGDEVRYPEFSYWLEARQFECKPLHAGCTEDDDDLGHWATGRWPSAGLQEVTVANTIRMRFLEPGGIPAANLPVVWSHSATPWSTTTDSQGYTSFTVPTEDPVVLAESTTNQSIMFTVFAFDSWPSGELTDPVEVDGLASHVGLTVNLGIPTIDAVDPDIQGQTFTLQPYTAAFFPPDQLPTEWGGEDCDYIFLGLGGKVCTEPYGNPVQVWQDVAEVPNLGGGDQIKARYGYTDSHLSESSWYASTGSGITSNSQAPVWGRAEGEVATRERRQESGLLSSISPWYGPDDNSAAKLRKEYHRQRVAVCIYLILGYKCWTEYEASPVRWSGFDQSDEMQWMHDSMDLTLSWECDFPFRGTVSSEIAKGTRIESAATLAMDGQYMALFGKVRFQHEVSSETNSESIYEWQSTNSDDWDYYIYVKHGRLEDPDHCPADYPEETFTHSEWVG